MSNDRKPTGLDTTDRQRYMREYQARRRGTKRSYKSEADSACVLLAWEAGEITEGVAAKLLGIDRVSARERKQCMIMRGVQLSRQHTAAKQPQGVKHGSKRRFAACDG